MDTPDPQAAQTLLEHALKWNEKLVGLPSGVLILIACAGLAILLRWLKFFPNRFIPLVVVGLSIASFMLTAPADATTALRIWIGRSFLIGLVIGIVACIIQRFVVRKWPAIATSDDTQIFQKPPDPQI